MGTKTIGRLSLIIQDNDELNSILPTAENFEKISAAYDDLYKRGYTGINTNKQPGDITATGRYNYSFTKNGKTSRTLIEADRISAAAGDFVVQRHLNIETGEKTILLPPGGSDATSLRVYENPSMAEYGPAGSFQEYSVYLTDQFWMGRRLSTALLPFTFVQNGVLAFSGIKGHVVRHEGILKGEFGEIEWAHTITKQKTLPYINGSYDNVHSAWLTFGSTDENDYENEIRMYMHGANSNVESCEGFVQIWFYNPEEESV